MILIRVLYKNRIYNNSFTYLFENGGLPGQVDLPRLQSGKVGGAFWSAYMPCPKDGFDFSDENYGPIVRATLDQLDLYNRLHEQYPHFFTPSGSGVEAEKAFKKGHLISPIGIEGLHQIGNSASTLRLYYQLGVRYVTLTHNCHNMYADAALVNNPEGKIVAAKPYWGGVSSNGRELIQEMNRMGMIVDLSHVSKNVMLDVLGGSPEKGWHGSLAPPIFSHSSAYALCPHPRNVPDDVLQLVKDRGGLVMINFAPNFISCHASDSPTGLPIFDPLNSTLRQVVSHIIHIGELIGYEYVGLGTDFDGIMSTPVGLEDVSKFPDLVAEMLRQGISDTDATKVVGRNLLRVWREVDRIAGKLQKELPPLEDDIKLHPEAIMHPF
jgi:membrane dipeptidase